ncbi:MAG: hypothetical protein IIC67_05140 [Thaumarchaeota archaeon]|nr:hypothetical protein [Nitrososphaerota archaeon]
MSTRASRQINNETRIIKFQKKNGRDLIESLRIGAGSEFGRATGGSGSESEGGGSTSVSPNIVKEKELEQWFFRTTKYQDELLKDLEKLEWPEQIKEMQKVKESADEVPEVEDSPKEEPKDSGADTETQDNDASETKEEMKKLQEQKFLPGCYCEWSNSCCNSTNVKITNNMI